MADNQVIDNPTNGNFTAVADEITSPYTGGSGKAQAVKLLSGTADANTVVAAGGGVEANALRVTVASDSTGVLSVDDNGGSLTVDGTVTTTPSGDHTVVGKAADGAAVSGNPVLMAGQDGTNVQSLKTDSSGELQVDVLTLPALAAGTANIGDVDVLTVPAPLSTTGGGTEATALRVTVATDSTGVLSIDDNGGSITVDGSVTAVASGDHTVVGKAADGAAVSGNPVLIAGQDGTNVQSLKTDSSGELQVDIVSAPATTRTTDHIGAADTTDVIMNGLTALTPKFKSVTVAASQTDSEVIALVSAKKLRILAFACTCGSTATTLTMESNGGSDTRLHKVAMAANGGMVLGYNPVGWFETVAGEALIATTGAGSDTEITLTYIEV